MRLGRGGFYRDNKGRALIMPVDGGERVAYDSPSGFGDWIENASSLTRHLNRQMVEGLLAHARTAELSGLEVITGWSKNLDGLTGYERTQQLDRIVELLHEAAKVSRKADKGSHVHAITEDSDSGRDWMARLRDGEDLGMGAEVQQRLVDAYHRLCDSFGLEVIEIEAPCVNDEWQLAGTLDRIARPTREVLVGSLWLQPDEDNVVDIKTSKMYRTKDGHLRFWQNYPIQIAGYQGSVPYDQESETRGEWERPLSHMTGLIVHLDIDKARVGADDIATLVAVSLSEGRMMGEMCVQARDVARGYEEGGIGAFAIVKPPDLELSADNPSSEPETCVREADSEQVSADSTDIDPLEARKSALRERWRALSDLGKRMYHSANIDPEDLDKADEILTRLEEGWDTHADLKAAGLVE